MKEEKEERQEKLPIDAKLLAEAVIELNISRRSVGLYPREHPVTRESIEKAFRLLEKLFEIRGSITLGVAKDALVIDEHTLDRKNPVFREFALSLSSRGIAAVTFSTGLTVEELAGLHELIAAKDFPAIQDLIDAALKKGLAHIRLAPLDMSRLHFVEGSTRKGGSERDLYEDYVYGLLEGKLADADAEGVILAVPPEDMALLLNARIPEGAPAETYERVIASYLRGKEQPGSPKEHFARFLSLVENLTPELKRQFLKQAFSTPAMDPGEAERLLGGLSPGDMERAMNLFMANPSLMPDRLRGLIDRLRTAKEDGAFFTMPDAEKTIVDDIEIDETVMRLFSGDHFNAFVSAEYQKELERMLKDQGEERMPVDEGLKRECRDEVIEQAVSEVMIELLYAENLGREVCLTILTKLSLLVEDFLETGRFQEISEIYNNLYSHALTGRFRDEASSMVEYYFRSEPFIAKLMDAFKLWGRHDKEGVLRLSKVLKRHLMTPLFDALPEETDASKRRFLLEVLAKLGNDVIPEAVKRLTDERWYVVRNMLYLIRECGGSKYVAQVRPFAKHRDRRVCMEAVRTLLVFRAPDALSYLKFYLRGKDPELRDQAIKLAGAYRIKEIAPYLIRLLEKKDLFGRELYYKIPVIRALGEIGDPVALGALKKLCMAKGFLYRDLFEEIRVDIFRSLGNYPRHAVKKFLELGLGSKNKEIRSMSEELVKRHGEADVKRKGS